MAKKIIPFSSRPFTAALFYIEFPALRRLVWTIRDPRRRRLQAFFSGSSRSFFDGARMKQIILNV